MNFVTKLHENMKDFVWCEGLVLKIYIISSCLWWFECLVCTSRCHWHGEWTDAAQRVLPPLGLWGNAVVLCLGNYQKRRLLSVGTASHWCDQPHCEGCYGSLRMDWLRTNGVCIPVHGSGMVKGALIECTERGLFAKQWEDCVPVPSEEEHKYVWWISHRSIQYSFSAWTPPPHHHHPTPTFCTQTLPLV